jgi:hypothetical protein
MAKNQLSLKSWTCIGAAPGLGFIIWLGLRYGSAFQPDTRGLVAICISTVITSTAAYVVHLRHRS